MNCPYEILGVERNASKAEIRAAYRRKAQENHPDRHQNSEASTARFQEIKDAFEILSDDDRRSQYDTAGTTEKLNYHELAASAVLQLFARKLDMTDLTASQIGIVEGVKNDINDDIVDLKQQEKKQSKIKEKTSKRRDLVKKKGGDGTNLFEQLIDHKINEIDINLFNIRRQIKVAEMALSILEEYEDADAAMSQRPGSGIEQFITTQILWR